MMTLEWDGSTVCFVAGEVDPLVISFDPPTINMRSRPFASLDYDAYLQATVGIPASVGVELRFHQDTRRLVGIAGLGGGSPQVDERPGDAVWSAWPSTRGGIELPTTSLAPDLRPGDGFLSRDGRLLVIASTEVGEALRLDIGDDLALLMNQSQIIAVALHRPFDHLIGQDEPASDALVDAGVRAWSLWSESIAAEIADVDRAEDFEMRCEETARALRRLGPGGDKFAEWLSWI